MGCNKVEMSFRGGGKLIVEGIGIDIYSEKCLRELKQLCCDIEEKLRENVIRIYK